MCSRRGKRDPSSASMPSAKAVSVDIAAPQPCADGPAGVHRQVDRHRHDHAAEPGQQRQRDPPPVAQLAHVELAPRLKAHHQEEQRHQPAVHPLAQVQVHPVRRRAAPTGGCPRPTRSCPARCSPTPAPPASRPAAPPRCPSRCGCTPTATRPRAVPLGPTRQGRAEAPEHPASRCCDVCTPWHELDPRAAPTRTAEHRGAARAPAAPVEPRPDAYVQGRTRHPGPAQVGGW